jgi:hypothetical protein
MKFLTTFIYLTLMTVLLHAQQIRGLRSNSQSDFPLLQWYMTNHFDSLGFQIFRAAHDDNNFLEIQTRRNQFFYSDTLILEISDTSLTTNGIWQYYILAKTSDGAAIYSDIMYAHNMGYLSPPEVFNFSTRPATDTKAIELNWELRSPATVVSQTLFRSRNFDDGYEWVTNLPANARSYTDPVTRANEPWFYFILIKDFFGYQPPGTRVHGFATFAEKPSTPIKLNANRQGNDIQLSWINTGDNTFGYRIYRRINGTGGFFPAEGPFYLPGEQIYRIDSMAVEPDTRILEYYCVSISDGYLESIPSDTIIMYIAENFMVNSPRELDYIVQPDGKVLTFWTPADDFSGISGYNVYRKLNDEPIEKVNRAILTDNYFLDTLPKEQGIIKYQVEALNFAEKPSDTRTEIYLEYNIPVYKLVLSCSQVQNGLMLEWVPIRMEGLKSLQIYRQKDDEETALLTTVLNEKGTYTDTRTLPGSSYIYFVIAEKENGDLIMINDGIVASRY